MAILPWGVETQGEVSQVLTDQRRVTAPWAIAGVLFFSQTLADYALSILCLQIVPQVTGKASMWTGLTALRRLEKSSVQSLACVLGRGELDTRSYGCSQKMPVRSFNLYELQKLFHLA